MSENVKRIGRLSFSIHKNGDDDEEDEDKLDEDDLNYVVDDLSDDEGDEGRTSAIIAMTKQEEKERHKEMLRHIGRGYDGR